MPFDEDSGGDALAFTVANRANTLPEIWLEHGGSLPVDSADALWDTPNLYAFARSDSRSRRNIGDTTQIYDPTQTGTSFGQSLYVIHRALRDEFAARWSAIGKPFRVIPMLVGVDDGAGDSPNRVATDPLDFVAGKQSFFKDNGRATTRAFFDLAAARYAELLDANGIARTEVADTMDDYESAYNFDATPTHTAACLADARASTSPVNAAGMTAAQWFAVPGRDTELDGSPLPAYNGSFNTFHPENWDAQRQSELHITAYAAGIDYAVAAPFRTHFGNRLRHGSWGVFKASRAHPIAWRPTQYQYLMDGDFALRYSVPVNYRYIPAHPWRSDASVDSDPRWETVTKVSAALGISPADQDQAATTFNIDLARTLIRISPIFPSFTIHEFPGTIGDATYTAARDQMIRWIVALGRLGVRRFWLFAPEHNTNADSRARLADFMPALRAAWFA